MKETKKITDLSPDDSFSTSTSTTFTTTMTNFDSSATGSHDFLEKKYVKHQFGKYEITVELTSDDKFLGITQVELNKDFRTLSQKISRTIVHDVEEYYKDE